MEREFMAFCDRCGQKLDWRGYKNYSLIRNLREQTAPGNSKLLFPGAVSINL